MKDELIHALGNVLLSLKQVSVLAGRFGVVAAEVMELDEGLSLHYSTKKFLGSVSENSLNRLSEDIVKLAKIAVTLSSNLPPGPNDIGAFLLCFSTLQQTIWALSEFLATELWAASDAERYTFLGSQLFASAHEMNAVIDGLVKKNSTLPETLVHKCYTTRLCHKFFFQLRHRRVRTSGS